ncbi:hypothetical protein [Pantoea sp. M_9]|uniref:hypothetical protein n=1 Tax=Pantoea sp. M_9 TaxID=2608041 RepID=UPI00123230F6|nr:hypothetical protein [Pantoea sp. M_9]KAA5972885.1 hypothetical protein F3I15_02475 [Pantoea sp. M_9]
MSVPSLISTKEASRLSAYAMGIGSELNMKDVTRPKGMLEHVIDVFTLGGVRREKEEVYKSVISELRSVLHDKKITPDSLQSMKKIKLNLNKMDITLRPDSRYNAMQIIVSKGSEKAEGFVPDSNFTALCSSIMLREKLGLSRDNDLLMPSGEINLTDIHEANLNSKDVVSILSNVPPQIKLITTEENVDRLKLDCDKLSGINHNTKVSGSNEPEIKINILGKSITSNDVVFFIEPRKNSDSDFDSAAKNSSSVHFGGETLNLYYKPEEDAESHPPLYDNMRNRKDLSVKVS